LHFDALRQTKPHLTLLSQPSTIDPVFHQAIRMFILLRPTFRLALTAAFVLTAGPAAANEFVVLKSKNLPAYNDAVIAFKTNCGGKYTEYDIDLDEAKGKAFVEQINAAKPTLVYTVGRHAARAVRLHGDKGIPSVFAMVLNPEREDLNADHIAGISLEIPVDVQLSALKAIVPRAKKIGVIYNPRNSNELLSNAMAVASKQGLEIVASKVDAPDDTPRALRAFADGIDAFWLIPDPTVVTPQAFRAILEFSQKSNVPFFAYNEAFVRAGALLSLGPNSASIGAQACTMAKSILGGQSPKSLGIAAPQGMELFLNMKTSEQLGLTSIAANAMSFSARQGVKINVTQ
jgi:putative tryptophan/tyrosine transport system substrate-binding protein